MTIFKNILFIAVSIWFIRCAPEQPKEYTKVQPIYQDNPFVQDWSVKHYCESNDVVLTSVASDRNGNIQVHSPSGLLF